MTIHWPKSPCKPVEQSKQAQQKKTVSQVARIRNLLAYSTPGAPPITLDDSQAQELLQEIENARKEAIDLYYNSQLNMQSASLRGFGDTSFLSQIWGTQRQPTPGESLQGTASNPFTGVR